MQDESLQIRFDKLEARLQSIETAIKDQTAVQRELIQEIANLSESMLMSNKEQEELVRIVHDFGNKPIDPDSLSEEQKERWKQIQAGLDYDAKMKDTGVRSDNLFDLNELKNILHRG